MSEGISWDSSASSCSDDSFSGGDWTEDTSFHRNQYQFAGPLEHFEDEFTTPEPLTPPETSKKLKLHRRLWNSPQQNGYQRMTKVESPLHHLRHFAPKLPLWGSVRNSIRKLNENSETQRSIRKFVRKVRGGRNMDGLDDESSWSSLVQRRNHNTLAGEDWFDDDSYNFNPIADGNSLSLLRFDVSEVPL